MSDAIDREMENRKGSEIREGAFPAGFLGKDEMREKAHKMLDHDLNRSKKSYPFRQSDSSRSTERLRPY